mgnify:CR=1 FL=1
MGTLYGEGTDKTALEGGLAETHANRMARLGAFLSQFKKQEEEEKQQTVWEVMSDEELMDKFGTNELDKFGIPKMPGSYNMQGERLNAYNEPYGEPNKSLIKTIWNKAMPDKLDFENLFSQPWLGDESRILFGKATNYPLTRTYQD